MPAAMRYDGRAAFKGHGFHQLVGYLSKAAEGGRNEPA